MPNNANLYAQLRAHFPDQLDDVAIETADVPASQAGHPFAPLHYTWRDLERGSARIANLFADLALPAGARVLVHADKSVEAVMLYLATLRAGLVYVPLNAAYQASEVEYFVDNAQPSVVVCAPRNFTWISRIAARLYARRWRREARGALLAEGADEQGAPAGVGADARIDLDDALKTLSDPERICVTLCYGVGLSHAEAALALNAPLGTVKSHVKRGLDKLRSRLSPDGDGGQRRQVGG